MNEISLGLQELYLFYKPLTEDRNKSWEQSWNQGNIYSQERKEIKNGKFVTLEFRNYFTKRKHAMGI